MACEQDEWRFAGSDSKRGASKWRCPTSECKPASVWIKANRLHQLILRGTPRYRKLYRGRSAVEREFSRRVDEPPTQRQLFAPHAPQNARLGL